VKCLLDYADSLFTQDTSETVNEARIIYLSAIDLMESAGLSLFSTPCQQAIANISVTLTDPTWNNVWQQLFDMLSEVDDQKALADPTTGIIAVYITPYASAMTPARLQTLRDAIYQQLAKQQNVQETADVIDTNSVFQAAAQTAAMGDKNVGAAAGTVRYTANAVYASSLSFTTGISGNTLSGTSTSLGFLTETPANEYNFGAPVSDMSGTLAAGTFVTVAGYNPAAPTQLQTATQIGIAN